MTVLGTYTPTRYAINMEMNSANMGGPSAGGFNMHMKTKVAGQRIGACPKKSADD